MDFSFILQCSFCTFILIYLIKSYFLTSSSSNHGGRSLPGPFCLPLVGHVQFLLKKEPYKYLAELGKTYGDIYKIQIGVKTVIVLNSLEVIKYAFNEWLFTGRPSLHSFDAISGSNDHTRLVFITLSPEWKFLRKNAIKALALFASSRNSRLQKVVEEASDSFHKDIMKNLGKPFYIKETMGECVAGIIGAINFGLQFNRNDPLLKKIVKLTDIAGRFIQLGTFLDYFPLGKFLMRNKVKKTVDEIQALNTVTETAIKSHKCNDEEPSDVADALYKRRLETTEEELKEANVTSEDIQMLSQDLFAAGFASTMESMTWALTLMAKYPEVQEKMAAELKEQIQPGVHPTVNDSKSTPYTEATILEILRFVSLVPLNVPHATVGGGQFRGYNIPENAIVISNLWNIHRNPEVFPRPDEFDPSRFLNPDGSINGDSAQSIAPFSVGKRRCAGENLARQELYLLLTATVLKFSICPAPGEDINVYDADPGFTRRVKQFKLVFSLRD